MRILYPGVRHALFPRLIRNGLENAIRYAKGEVVLDSCLLPARSSRWLCAMTGRDLPKWGLRLLENGFVSASSSMRTAKNESRSVLARRHEGHRGKLGGALTAGNWRALSSVGGAEIKIRLL